MGSSHLQKRLLIVGALILSLGIGMTVYLAISTWGQVNRVTIERPEESSSEEPLAGEPGEEPAQEEEADPEPADPIDGNDVFLLVGSDSREELEDPSGFGDFEGRRADVVMVILRSTDDVAVLSLPRDLWVDSACDGEPSRLSEELGGCDDGMNGPTLLTLTVESMIGETIDHFALVDLAGFQGAVDAIGGYEICLERPVRDRLANLALPAGCTLATGEQTLAWLRSRRTQELTDDGWRLVPGVNDLARNSRQREFLIDMMGRLSDFASPQSLAGTAQAIAPFVTVDDELSLVTAVDLAWTLRGLGEGHMVQLEVPVVDHTTDQGAAVLLPSTPVDDIVTQFLAPEIAERDAVIESRTAGTPTSNPE